MQPQDAVPRLVSVTAKRGECPVCHKFESVRFIHQGDQPPSQPLGESYLMEPHDGCSGEDQHPLKLMF